jgi:hypothetical protein
MPMLDPSHAVVPVTTEKRKLCMFCHSLKEAPKRMQCEDAPRERRDVSRMLQVQVRARQQQACIHSPVDIPVIIKPNT